MLSLAGKHGWMLNGKDPDFKSQIKLHHYHIASLRYFIGGTTCYELRVGKYEPGMVNYELVLAENKQ